MANFHVIDFIFMVLIVLLIVHGFVRGFIAELFAWAALVAAILAAVFLHPIGAGRIRESLMPNVRYVPEVLSFVGVFLVTMVVFKLLERILKNVIEGINLGIPDKIFGALFGFAEGVTITALALFVMNVQPFFNVSNIIRDSFFARILLPYIDRIPFERGMEIINVVLVEHSLIGHSFFGHLFAFLRIGAPYV